MISRFINSLKFLKFFKTLEMEKFNTKNEVKNLLERIDEQVLQSINRTGEAFLSLEQSTGIEFKIYENIKNRFE